MTGASTAKDVPAAAAVVSVTQDCLELLFAALATRSIFVALPHGLRIQVVPTRNHFVGS